MSHAFFLPKARRVPASCALLALLVLSLLLLLPNPAAADSTPNPFLNGETREFLTVLAGAFPELGVLWNGTLDDNYCSGVQGVKCNTKTGFLEISHPTNYLTGTLPELGEHIDGSKVLIDKMYLSKGITGLLPNSWGRLTNLRVLQLRDNSISGSLPASWSGLSKLEELYLSGNQITGTLPPEWASGMKSLSILVLQGNPISGSLPAEWGKWTSIAQLQLGYMRLSGTLPNEWNGMVNLRTLYLEYNALTGGLPEWPSLTKLVVAHLAENRMDGSLSASWANIPLSIDRGARFYSNSFCGCVPANWSTHAGLQRALDEMGANARALLAPNCATANVCGGPKSPPDSPRDGYLNDDTRNFLKALAGAITDLGASWNGTLDEIYCIGVPGIECDASTGLISINSPTQRVHGSLPELGAHIDGSKVMVGYIALQKTATGSLPTSWGSLSNLRRLWIGENNFNSTLPASWGGMSSLQELYIFSSQITGTLPPEWASGMKSLSYLNLQSNPINGTLPAEWGKWTSVTQLQLGHMRLSGTLPNEWNGMVNLRTLYLQYNALTGGLPEWPSLTKLRVAHLPNNRMDGSLSASWANMPLSIDRGAQFYGNSFCGCVPANWSTHPGLQRGLLEMGANARALTAPNCADANACPDISSNSGVPPNSETDGYLNDDTRNFLKTLSAAFVELGALWNGTLDENYCYGVTGIECNRETGFLEIFFPTNYLTGSLPEIDHINGSNVMIDAIYLHRRISGPLPDSWGILKNLRVLQLRDNSISGSLPASWSGLSKLEELYLSGNQITGTLPPEWASGMKSLSILVLQGNPISGSLPAEWGNWTSIAQLQLGYMRLSGTLPNEWNGMVNLRTLYLEYNALTGGLPEWPSLTKLVVAHLAENRMDGSLSASWANMPLSIDRGARFYSNSFCGCVPANWSTHAGLQRALDEMGANARALLAPNCADANACPDISSSLPPNSDTDGYLNDDTRNFLKALAGAITDLGASWNGTLDENYCYGVPGIECEASTGLISINSPTQRVHGSLPELGAHINGSKVMVGYIALQKTATGSLPTSWGSLSNLRRLFISENNFNSTLPASWGGMSSLQELHLRSSQITGTLPPEWASGMKSLSSLNLQGNPINGTLPAEWGNWTSVTQLQLNYMRLSGTLPNEWNGMVNLRYLYLQYNALTGGLPEWPSLGRLNYVNLAENAMGGCLSPSWARMPLKSVSLYSSAYVGCVPRSWKYIVALQAALDDMGLVGEALRADNCSSTANDCPAEVDWSSDSTVDSNLNSNLNSNLGGSSSDDHTTPTREPSPPPSVEGVAITETFCTTFLFALLLTTALAFAV